MGEVQQTVNEIYLFFFMLKPLYLLTQVSKENKEARDNIFENMCNCGTWEEWRIRIISARTYDYFKTKKGQ